MPYRGESGPRIACAAHAAAEAVGSCIRCRVPLCDPCTLYFSADPFCRNCVGRARRAWVARISGGVAGVMLLMAVVTGVMLAAIPSHVRARAVAAVGLTPVRHVENCRPFDQWLAEARRDLDHGRPHNALHDVSLSRRDCAFDSERDRIEALAYAAIGDKFAAIAAVARYADVNDEEAVERLRAAVQERLSAHEVTASGAGVGTLDDFKNGNGR
jgi:hypothetical protein